MVVTEMKAVHSRLLPPDHSPNPSKSTETPGNIRTHALPELTPEVSGQGLEMQRFGFNTESPLLPLHPLLFTINYQYGITILLFSVIELPLKFEKFDK